MNIVVTPNSPDFAPEEANSEGQASWPETQFVTDQTVDTTGVTRSATDGRELRNIPDPRTIKKILCPFDGTPQTADALGFAGDLARQLDASVTVLYVLPPTLEEPAEPGSVRLPRYTDHAYYDWMQWAEDLCESIGCPPGVEVQSLLSCGDIAASTIRVAEDRAFDLIVLVRRSNLEEGHGFVIKRVLEQAPCPVLILDGRESVT